MKRTIVAATHTRPPISKPQFKARPATGRQPPKTSPAAPDAADEVPAEASLFRDLHISKDSKRAIADMGFEFMTPVQQRTLPSILAGKDVLARAATGTGKTVAFMLPCIEKLMQKNSRQTRVLVLSPTRELADQIAKESKLLAKYHPVSVEIAVGGTNMGPEAGRLMASGGVDIVVGTPGRLLAHLRETAGFAQRLKSVEIVALDEGDRLLDSGFKNDILKILGFLPTKESRQTLLFSATIPPELHEVKNQALKENHEFIDTIGTTTDQSNDLIDQECTVVRFENVLFALEKVLEDHIKDNPDFKIVVFFPTARIVEFNFNVFEKLFRDRSEVLEMHSRKSQSHRNKTAETFKKNSRIMMFTSDVSARGVILYFIFLKKKL
ncbi:hypothetical protein HK096_003067 [Nowakowskiella sp. JEL0078]|nr:hypothetical protein HK096_003067 [Nowakowskiella sp. JEL0078]